MPASPAREKIEVGMFSRLAGFGLVFFGIGNGHPQSFLHSTMDTNLIHNYVYL